MNCVLFFYSEGFMSADIIILKNLYLEIYRQCAFKFMEHPTGGYANIFPKIINSCESLLTKCEEGYVEQWHPEDDENAFQEGDEAEHSIDIENEIKKSYHSVWMNETLNQDDAYFLENKQARLLDCDEGKNPYRALKQTVVKYKEKTTIREADVVKLFRDTVELLREEMPYESIVNRVNVLFAMYNEFLNQKEKKGILFSV